MSDNLLDQVFKYFKLYFSFIFYRIFNTNNLWINLDAMKRVMDDKSLHMEIIVNPKVSFRFDIAQGFKIMKVQGL